MSRYSLLINDRPLSEPDLVSVSVRYNAPRELVFCTASPRDAQLNSTVSLAVDGVQRFSGRIVRYEVDPALAKKHRYSCLDWSEDSDAVQILKWKRVLAAGQLWAMFYGRYSAPLAELLDEIAAAVGDDLRARGIVGDAVFEGDRGGTVAAMDLQPAGFRAMLDRVLDAVPGMRWLYVPAETPGDRGAFRIVNVFAAGEQTVSVPGGVENLTLTRSIEGRFSRVRIEPIVYSSAGIAVSTLQPAWNAGLEATWSLAAVGQQVLNAGESNPMADVFRRYSYGHLSATVLTDSPMELVQVVSRFPGDMAGTPVSVQIGAIDPERKYIWCRWPAINYYVDRRGGVNAWVPGQAKRALSVLLRHSYVEEHIATEVAVGPAGTAWSLYGLDRELRVREDSVANVTPERARAILDLVKDEMVSGTVPLFGDVPEGLWNLGARVRIDGTQSGLEQIGAIVTGVTHEFGGGGRTTIEITTDRSAFATGVTAA